jgi:hypothetical protein
MSLPGSSSDATPMAVWYRQNKQAVDQADVFLGKRLANSKHCGETIPTKALEQAVDEVFSVLAGTAAGDSNRSVLLLGEAQSGKTHVVEHCLKQLVDVEPSTVVLRARGSAYGTDVECLRHLAAQATGYDKLAGVPHRNASFEVGMEWMSSIFRGAFSHGTKVILVLDEFEHFCSRPRQTLLYNLFNLAEGSGMRLSIVGTSTKLDVMDSDGNKGLEKRIRSRFSMQHLHTYLPTDTQELVEVLMTKLRLPDLAGKKGAVGEYPMLTKKFVSDFNVQIEEALKARQDEWQSHVDLGRSISWFLARCLPLAAFFQDTESYCSEEPKAKRRRVAGSATRLQETMLLLDALTQNEHLVLMSLVRLKTRKLPLTLATVLCEIKKFHLETSHVAEHFNADWYSAAFVRLLSMNLIELESRRTADTGKHAPCRCSISDLYTRFCKELFQDATATSAANPLRKLPSGIQQWVSQIGKGPC